MQHNYITISLGLPEFVVERVEETEHLIEIWVRKADPVALCPRCGHPTDAFHDERIDDVWDVPLLGVKFRPFWATDFRPKWASIFDDGRGEIPDDDGPFFRDNSRHS